ncbi:protease SohB [Thiopseudomonas denitrificans]|uniref:Inner membrane peptidase n=1 Tax=Thiopseudomonas denitrificans TaxID=1501432 RepID=A0A4R6U103_9GAMM|nr:protease SohB [Thiopseudomonas denitrificans]TDQ39980.1 inner membrane peptidase [Thiopseudomonas denitrificans]
MDFLLDYAGFLLRAATVLIVLVVLLITVAGLKGRQRSKEGELEVRSINERLDDIREGMQAAVLDKAELKKLAKQRKQQEKHDKKNPVSKPRVFVLDFDGDIRASATDSLRQEVTAVLSLAGKDDEVVLRLESGGGMVHSYGLASSQLARIRDAQIPLTVCVDKVAASGGYMMACIGNKILSAPFAVLGSIGVVAQMPNIHRLLKKNDIDVEVLTAGEYKRTLTFMGENTEQGRAKFLQDLQTTHDLFKNFVARYRPQLDMATVATGEVWLGTDALAKQLVDEISTSDQYLVQRAREASVFQVSYSFRKNLQERIGLAAASTADNVATRLWQRLQQGFWH